MQKTTSRKMRKKNAKKIKNKVPDDEPLDENGEPKKKLTPKVHAHGLAVFRLNDMMFRNRWDVTLRSDFAPIRSNVRITMVNFALFNSVIVIRWTELNFKINITYFQITLSAFKSPYLQITISL
jgi:hypothetical protein